MRELEVRRLAEKLLYDLTQLPGPSSDSEKQLGRALTRFLISPHLSADALLDVRGGVIQEGEDGH